MTLKDYVDYTGKKIGYLTVITRVDPPQDKDQKKVYWSCTCDCTKETIVTSWTLKHWTFRLPSCGCKKYEKGTPANRKHKSSTEVSINTYMSSYIHGAQRRNLDWNLSREQFVSLIYKKCYFCGIDPCNKRNTYISKKGKKTVSGDKEWQESATVIVNGIDRMNNSLGYEINNCVTCCTQCNSAKNYLSYNDFIEWIKRVYNTRINNG